MANILLLFSALALAFNLDSLLLWFLASMMVFFLKLIPMSTMSVMFASMTLFDETMIFMVFMTMIVLVTSYYVITWDQSLNWVFILTFLSCLLTFSSNNMFIIYLGYELSILPIVYMIIQKGSYPDRSTASLFLLVFTAIFALPFSLVIFYSYESINTLNLTMINSFFTVSAMASLLIFLTFSVKLPIYGLHYWLPLAHVEAPTSGSMILAGVLLKLGGVGLIRFSGIMNLVFLKEVIASYLVIFFSLVTFICSSQTDFKRLIAYSSVSHMMAIPLLLFTFSMCSVKVIVMVMFFHGLSSPLLFSLVGSSYNLYSSRMLAVIRGLILLVPLMALVSFLGFLMTLSAPPIPSFLAEVLMVFSIMGSFSFSSMSLFLFLFLSMVYNLHWFASIAFSSSNQTHTTKDFYSFKILLPQVVLILINVPMIFLVGLF